MEVAGAKEMPDDAERKGLGTPATRAGIIEKLIATGFVERKKAKKDSQPRSCSDRRISHHRSSRTASVTFAHRRMGAQAENGGARRNGCR